MKVLIAGAGAIGQWLGARLSAAQHEVVLLARPVHAQAIKAGLHIRGHTTFNQPLTCVTEARAAGGGFDVAIITSKAHQTSAVAQGVVANLGAKGILLSLQNGFGNAQKLQRITASSHVVVALTSHGVTIENPGHLLHAGVGPTLVGPATASGAASAKIAQQLLADAQLDPEYHEDMRPMIWRKAIANAAINPLGALHGLRNGELIQAQGLLHQARDVVAEGVKLAAAAGVTLPPGNLVEAMEGTLRRTADNKCSMLQDVEAQRPTEIEQITGRLVRLAQAKNIAVPNNAALYEQIKKREALYLGQRAADMAYDEIQWEREPF